MKILILGCGSIGTRHAKNLASLGITNLILCDQNPKKANSLSKMINSNHVYTDYRKAILEHNDVSAAIICTPTSLHIAPSIFFAKKGINLFIEKPLSHTLLNLQKLSKIIHSKHLVLMMGHAYMFEDGFIKLKSILDKDLLGKIFFVTYLQGQYLPNWHPLADYRTEYSARKDLGGGALLTLTSHSFYVIEWLFGRIDKVIGGVISKSGSLDVDVDDSVFLLLKTNKNIIVQTQNNFIVKIHQHKLIVEGEKGKLEYDFVDKKITLDLINKKTIILHTSKDNNSRFLNEMKYFIKQLKLSNVDENLDLNSGIRFLKTVKKSKLVNMTSKS